MLMPGSLGCRGPSDSIWARLLHITARGRGKTEKGTHPAVVGVSLGRLRGGGSSAQAKWGTRVDSGTGGYADSHPPWDPALPRAGCPSPPSPCFATWCPCLCPSCLTVLDGVNFYSGF